LNDVAALGLRKKSERIVDRDLKRVLLTLRDFYVTW